MGMGNLGSMRALSSSLSSLSSSSAAALIMVMLCLAAPKVSSSSGHVGAGYEHVATVYPNQESGEWGAPCFLKNTAKLVEVYELFIRKSYAVIVVPHHGKCWTCRDDYQMRVGDQILATGSTYFGGGPNHFALPHDKADLIESQGIDIYVDMNAACNALPNEAIKNPFKRVVVESVAMD